MNNPTTNADTNPVKINNKNLKDCPEKREHQIETKPLKLKIVITDTDQMKTTGSVLNVVNDLSKTQSPAIERNSTNFVMSGKDSLSPNKPKANQPIMGRNALLKKANMELDDSLIIHELITDKYSDVLNHYYSRMYHRKLSRQENSDEEYSETVFSSPPSYSPASLSSISTSNSTCPDEKNGFSFPSSQESPEKNVYRFIVSTDDANIETTVEDFEASSMDSTSIATSDYDANKFLDNALGAITNSDRPSNSNDVDEESQTDHRKHDDHNLGNSECKLISKATSLYTTVKKTIKRRYSFRSAVAVIPEDLNNDNRLSATSDNPHLDNLMRELSIQNEITFQVSKALNYCKTTKEFESSVEHIEAEKILLVALCTKEALTKEIQYMEDDTYERKDDDRSCGQVEISHLKFPGKNLNKTESDVHPRRDFTEHFLVILTCASSVLASDVVVAEENGHVNIEKTFRFTKLPTDFDISVCIYSMRVGNKVQQQEQKSNCPSTARIFCHLQKDSKKYKVLNDVLHIKPSSFSLWGKCEIRSPDLSKTKLSESSNELTLKLHNTPLSSSLLGTFSMKIKSEVKLMNKVSGFLTLGVDNEHGCTIWNRRWCVLEGPNFKYWNYPSEEVISPCGSVDLRYCVDQQVCSADRGMCARPRTLLLPIRHNQTIRKYLLSADNHSDMKQWETEINYVIFALRVWNHMNE